uniref:insulin-like growth factor-binding protein 2 isoform X2 n=1 Tax=Myxine glutinosa TaxID=7769 RepID=UPI00358FABB4
MARPWPFLVVLLGLTLSSGCARGSPRSEAPAFRCPPCTPERLALCPPAPGLGPACSEIVRAPGCGCCPGCALRAGQSCGVYAARCGSSLRCYPRPGQERPLDALVRGRGVCGSRAANNGDLSAGLNSSEMDTMTVMAPVSGTQGGQGLELLGPLPAADEKWRALQKKKQQQRRSELRAGDDGRTRDPVASDGGNAISEAWPSNTAWPDTTMSECRTSLHGQRGECWCVHPESGSPIAASPIVRGHLDCQQYLAY